MAEVLGVVSSVIAIGQVASAVGKAAFKLKRLWDEVDNMPEQIKDLLEELDMLEPLLQQIDKQLTCSGLPQDIWEDSSAKKSKALCQKAVDTLREAADDLGREIQRPKGKLGRKVASAKAVLKKDMLRKHERKLEKALKTLGLSIQCYNMVMSRMSYDGAQKSMCQIREGMELVVQVSRVNQEIQRPTKPHKKETSEKSVKTRAAASVVYQQSVFSLGKALGRKPPLQHSSLGSVSYESTPDGKIRRIRFQLPQWFSEKVWEVESRRAYSGWQQILLRTYTMRDADHPVFDEARRGLPGSLRKMFDEGEASPFDYDPQGNTLLQYAVDGSNPGSCRTLLDLGVDCIDEKSYFRQGGRNFTSARKEVLNWYNPPQQGVLWGLSDELSVVKYRIAIADLFWKYDYSPEGHGTSHDLSSLGWEDFFLSQLHDEGVSSYHSSPLRYRLLAARNHAYQACWNLYHPNVLRYLINQDQHLLRRDISDSVGEGVSLIHTCALALGCMSRSTEDRHYEYAKNLSMGLHLWNGFAKEIIMASTMEELHTIEECTMSNFRYHNGDGWIGTPLTSFFRGLALGRRPRTWNICVDQGMRNWLKLLKGCGVDLVQFGQREKAAHATILADHGETMHVHLNDGRWKTESGYVMELRDFSFGHEPADWDFAWELDICRMAGEFLRMAEAPGVVEALDTSPGQSDGDTRGTDSPRRAFTRMPGAWRD